MKEEKNFDISISISNSLTGNIKVNEYVGYSLGAITTNTVVWQGGWVTDNYKTYYVSKAKLYKK
jgi:hypothetical protein